MHVCVTLNMAQIFYQIIKVNLLNLQMPNLADIWSKQKIHSRPIYLLLEQELIVWAQPLASVGA